MYCARPATRSPSVYRIVSAAPKRNAHFFPGFPGTALSTPFFGRTASQDPFRALDRMLEDLTSPSFPFAPQQLHLQPATPTFQPRFDVREAENGYELRGEIPGVESKDLEVEFVDPQTLVVRGRTERESSSGTPPQAIQSEKGKERITNDETTKTVATEAADATAEKAADNSDAASTYSTGSYQKPSVEDADTETATEAKDTPATTPGEPVSEQQQQQQVATQAQPEAQPKQQSHYWISERSTGSFQRVFKFPTRVDQAAVTASLKNGILNIVVPRAAKPEPRRIQIE